jgi:hypothetical protein
LGGDIWRGPVRISERHREGNVGESLADLADRGQPRLAGCVTCLVATFEDLCILCVAIFLWKR